MEIDHLDLVVRDLDASLDFYRGLLGPLGWMRESPIVGERGERVVYLGRVGEAGQIGLREAQSDAPHDRYAVGIHHLAIGVESREVVDERYAWLESVGAEIESEPREYDYAPNYYAVFFRDPSQIKLELVHSPG
jgi:catechol 2,3-dioxygenase-like lactoylglutathione lyase family enzyme